MPCGPVAMALPHHACAARGAYCVDLGLKAPARSGSLKRSGSCRRYYQVSLYYPLVALTELLVVVIIEIPGFVIACLIKDPPPATPFRKAANSPENVESVANKAPVLND